MKKRPSSLLSCLLACVVLLLQLAASSQILHDHLHGFGDVANDCSQSEHPCGPMPSDEGHDSCGDMCVVVLLAGGVALTGGLQAEPARSQITGKMNVAVRRIQIPVTPRVVDTRAPPVL